MWGVVAFGLGEIDAVVGAWIGRFRKLSSRSSRRVSSTAALSVLRGSTGGIGTILGVCGGCWFRLLGVGLVVIVACVGVGS